MCGATNQIATPRTVNAGATTAIARQQTRKYWLIFRPWRSPIARDRAEVRPVDRPTQTAIMRNSSGTTSPIAATEASPRSAA